MAFQSGAMLAESILNSMGSEDHSPAAPDDFIGADNRLHCGKCLESKEYRLPNGHYVPSLCRCGRMAREAEEIRQEQQRMMAQVNELAQYNMLGTAKLKGATFDTAEQREDGAAAFEIGRRYVRDFESICKSEDDLKGLLLYGPVGTGKTHLAACIANELMNKFVPVLFTSVIELTGLYPDELSEVLYKMRSAQLLVLDDLGAERNTDFKLEQVYNVVNSRCNDMKPLIVTTNVTLDDMRSEQDMRYRRIWERVRSMCRPVRMDGESWRKQRTIDAMRRLKEAMK